MNSILILMIGGLIFTAFQQKSEKKTNMILIGATIFIFCMVSKEGLTQIFVPGQVGSGATCTPVPTTAETCLPDTVGNDCTAFSVGQATCPAGCTFTVATVASDPTVCDRGSASQVDCLAIGGCTYVGPVQEVVPSGRVATVVGQAGDPRFTELTDLFPSCTLGKTIKADGTCALVTCPAPAPSGTAPSGTAPSGTAPSGTGTVATCGAKATCSASLFAPSVLDNNSNKCDTGTFVDSTCDCNHSGTWAAGTPPTGCSAS